MKIHLISGFLGSGKTTAIQYACAGLLQKNNKVAVISNDQGIKLVDDGFFNSLGIPSRKVVNGCFCCNYNDLDRNILSLIAATQPDVIFAESVGSCTDIVATVMKPLKHYHADITVTVTTFADVRLCRMLFSNEGSVFDESVNYIYQKQLEEAGIIVVNKIDLMDEQQLPAMQKMMQEKYPGKIILYQNSLDATSVAQWLKVLDTYTGNAPMPSLEIDYDIYGRGEAMLAWFDQELELHSKNENAMEAAAGLIDCIFEKINKAQYAIGHLKFLLNRDTKISFTTIAQPGLSKNIRFAPAFTATLLINARVQVEPEVLSKLIDEAITETEIFYGCTINIGSEASFKPGYPMPAHRIA